MNNKGFTVIELVGIILILALILLVSFPSILNLSKSDKEKEYNNMVKNLCIAGESYIHANSDSYSELLNVGSIINIDIRDLMSYGNVDTNVKNPNTKLSVSDDTLTYTVGEDHSLSCEYIDN